MRYVCHICGDTDSEGGCFSGKWGEKMIYEWSKQKLYVIGLLLGFALGAVIIGFIWWITLTYKWGR